MKINAYGKINLSLDIVGRREDGYHDMCMVMQTVDLVDELELNAREEVGIEVLSNLSYLPKNESNLAARAAKVYQRRCGGDWDGLLINIVKHIPVCSGMGGGSADAAAVLRCLNQCSSRPVSMEQLALMGAEVGSDVPFCVMGGTALAEGLGERLTSLPALPECYIVLCKPPFSISTPELFGCLDMKKIHYRPDTGGILASLRQGDLNGLAQRVYNIFEDVLSDYRIQEIHKIKDDLLSSGALGASMSGTGPAVFGLFDNPRHAKSAFHLLKKRYQEVYLTRPVRKNQPATGYLMPQ